MPQIIKQLLGSEKFVYVLLLWQLPMTVFAALGKVGIDAWREDAIWVLGILVGGKTLQGAAAAFAKPAASEPPKEL